MRNLPTVLFNFYLGSPNDFDWGVRSLLTHSDSTDGTISAKERYGLLLRTKINLKKRSDLPGEINSDIKNMCSNKQNATLKQKIMVQDNKKRWF